MEITMKSVSNKILQEDFDKASDKLVNNKKHQWYQRLVYRGDRGDFILFLCDNDIFGLYDACSLHEYDFDEFIRHIGDRSHEAANEIPELLKRLKAKRVIDFEADF